MTFARERPPSGGEGGLGNSSCLEVTDGPETSRIERLAQAEILPFPRAHRARPRRAVHVRISATSDNRVPIGRTRAIRLDEPDIERLIDFALRLETRRRR
jgi:hypothetical protein